MAVRETLELDFTRSITEAGKLDARLQEAFARAEADARKVGATLNQSISGTGLTGIESGFSHVGVAVEDTTKKTTAYGESLDTVTNKAHDHTESLRTMSTQATITGAAILGAFGLATKAATDLQTALAPVGTLLGASSAAGKELTVALKDVIANSPQSPTDIGASAYTILSAGISGTKNVLDTLRASQKLSEAGLGTLGEATNLVTSAIASFSKEGLTADQAARLLFGTITLGKTTTAGLAEGFGQIAPLAASAGVSFHDLLAATAALTATGQTAAIAYTGLRGILTGILQPTADAAKAAERLGIDFSVGHLQQVGLAKFLDEVKTATHGSVAEMSNLFGNVEGLNSALSLTGPQAQQFAKNLVGIDDAGKNLNSRAKEIEDTVGNQLATAFNKLKVSLAEAIAPILPFIGAAGSGLAALADSLSALPQGTQLAGGGLIALVGAGTLAFGAIAKVNLALNTASEFLVGYETKSKLVNDATTSLGNNLGLLARSVGAIAIFPILGQQLEQLTGDFDSAGLAAGALAGTLVAPGIGTAVGAALGFIAGNLGVLGDNAQTADEKMQGVLKTFQKLNTEQATNQFLATSAKFFKDATDEAGHFNDVTVFGFGIGKSAAQTYTAIITETTARFKVFQDLANADPASAKLVIDGLKARGIDTGIYEAALAKVIGTQKEHQAANSALAGSLGDVSGATGAAADTFDVLTGAMTDAKTATEDFAKAQSELENQLLGVPGAAINVEQALRSQQKAQEDLTKAQQEGDPGKITDAQLALEDANLRVASSVLHLSTEQDKLNTSLAGSPEVIATERQHLVDLQTQFPLAAAAIQPLIDKLDEASRIREIHLFLAGIEQAEADAQAFIAFLNSLGISQTGGFIAAQFNQQQQAQSGGPVLGPIGAPVPIVAHGGEFVLSADVVKAIKTGGPTEGLGRIGSTSASPVGTRAAAPLIGTLIVQGETPNAVKVAKETSREARAFMFLGGPG